MLAEYFFDKNQKQKAKEFYNQILNYKKSNEKIVTEAQKRNTLKVFKQESRAKSILHNVKEQLKLSDEEYEEVLDAIYTNYPSLYQSLEELRYNAP